eukprot:451460-Hanusia_phi.AAC.10
MAQGQQGLGVEGGADHGEVGQAWRGDLVATDRRVKWMCLMISRWSRERRNGCSECSESY